MARSPIRAGKPVRTTDWFGTDRLRVSVAEWLSPPFSVPHCFLRVYTAIRTDLPSLDVTATAVVIVSDQARVLHSIHVMEDQRRCGYGSELLEAIMRIEPRSLCALWCTEAGQALASSFERTHGLMRSWDRTESPICGRTIAAGGGE